MVLRGCFAAKNTERELEIDGEREREKKMKDPKLKASILSYLRGGTGLSTSSLRGLGVVQGGETLGGVHQGPTR